MKFLAEHRFSKLLVEPLFPRLLGRVDREEFVVRRKWIDEHAYADLVNLYLQVIRETTNWLSEDGRRGAPIGRLLADAASASESLTIVTFNHDLVIENEINRRAHLRRRWCLDLDERRCGLRGWRLGGGFLRRGGRKEF